jgi:hypothetical protein
MAKTPEGKVKDKVKKLLDSYESIYYFMPIGTMYSRIGVPDIIGSYQGRFFAIECKAGSNKPTALQEREMELIRRAGARVAVINETNIDDIKTMLETT